jgi:hypothetical protein
LLAHRPVELRSDLQRAFPLRAHRNLQEQIARTDIAAIVRQQIARHRGNLPTDSSHYVDRHNPTTAVARTRLLADHASRDPRYHLKN